MLSTLLYTKHVFTTKKAQRYFLIHLYVTWQVFLEDWHFTRTPLGTLVPLSQWQLRNTRGQCNHRTTLVRELDVPVCFCQLLQ